MIFKNPEIERAKEIAGILGASIENLL